MPFILFFLILLRPPSSTLFPYTTLFRSLDRERRPHRSASRLHHRMAQDAREERLPRRLPGGGRGRDRKSTRLNSSHVSISYAVFCLKKKNCGNPRNPLSPHARPRAPVGI